MKYTTNGYEFSDISFLPKSENDLDVSMAVQTTAEIPQHIRKSRAL
ncbi:MAG: hypothetical protein JNM71_06880 [Flavobacterium lindanitolerans]|nr:hypothetical protein [Flavobacterium lindanitolerans]MBL7867727.1 hypothetical protein [Flavobacterium lindanitolerans]